MSKAYEMISESLNEIINDLEKNDGKNLIRESAEKKFSAEEILLQKTFYVKNEKYFEQVTSL